MKELKQILQKVHNSCKHKEGTLKNISYEELKKMNDKYVQECTYCPFEKCGAKICSATEDVLFHNLCYNCNKCEKWSISEKELKNATNKMIEEQYGL